MNVSNTTVQYDNCIGCGICKSVCPKNAISMIICEEIYAAPVIDAEKCVNCGICSKYCPQAKNTLISFNKRVASETDFNLFGMSNMTAFLAWSDEAEVKKSASGGIATAIARTMLSTKMIDAVIHASCIHGKFDRPHYIGVISRTEEELNTRRGSFYSAIDFSGALEEIQNNQDIHNVLVIGTPCITRSLKPLLLKNSKYGIDVCYSMTLACSHNVNGMFAAYMADSLGVDRNQEWIINHRDKGGNDGIENAANFFTAFFDKNGKLITRKNRFSSQWTVLWRNYAFCMNCCNSCSDFWGADSDISLKDAWYKWNYDKESKNIVIIRNSLLTGLFDKLPIHTEKLDLDTIVKCQQDTVKYKQGTAKKRSVKNFSEWNKIDFLHKMHSFISKRSKFLYMKMMRFGYHEKLYREILFFQFLIKYNPLNIPKKLLRKLSLKYTR